MHASGVLFLKVIIFECSTPEACVPNFKPGGNALQIKEEHNDMKMKRTLAIAIGIMAIATLITLTSSRSSATPGGPSAPQLDGTWEVTVLPTGGDPIVDFATFTKDGGIINTDPDPNLSTGLGTWVRTGNHFAVTFVHFLSAGGSPLGTIKVRAELTLDPLTDTFSGPFRTDVIIGGNVADSFCGTVQARRVNVEPRESCP